MNKRKTLLLTISLAIITTLIGYFYIGNVKEEAIEEAQIERIQIVTANQVIPAHTEVTEEMLELIEYPEEVLPESAIKDIEDILEKKTNTDILPGEPILEERVVIDDAKSDLSYRIPESMRAVTILTNELSSVGGYIGTGDRVDMLVAYSIEEDEEDSTTTGTEVYTQMQNIEVLMTGPKKVEGEGVAPIPTSLTLLVSPEQAEVIAYANQQGVIQLTLRNPADEDENTLDGFGDWNFDDWKER